MDLEDREQRVTAIETLLSRIGKAVAA